MAISEKFTKVSFLNLFINSITNEIVREINLI